MKKIAVLLLVSTLFSGCFEWIEDLQLNQDGSGIYKTTLNLSSSKFRVKSVLALDSINGKAVPSMDEIDNRLASWCQELEKRKTITKASHTLDRTELIVKLVVHFNRLDRFQQAVVESFPTTEGFEVDFFKDWMTFDGRNFERKQLKNIPEEWQRKWQEDEDFDKLTEAKCVFIHRFFDQVKEVDHPTIKVSKNGKNTMLHLNPLELVNSPENLTYSIKF